MLRKVPVLFFCFAMTVSFAHAGITDPIHLHKGASLERSKPFFYPLTKKFYKDHDKVAVETILLESLGEGFKGMVAVGEVIRNREKLFLKTPEEVCRMPKQFSCWNDEERARVFLRKHRPYYFVALLAWKHSGSTSLTQGATDYHADSILPYWVSAYRESVRIKNHVFYVRQPNDKMRG